MIVDEVTIDIFGGKGGDGAVSFRREKFVPRGGPDGGNGGDGGDVYVESVNDLTALRYFSAHKKIKAEKGEDGRSRKQHGADGDDTIIKVPYGTTITDLETGEEWEFEEEGKRVLLAKGGQGGRGNWEFRSNENKAPRIAEDGEKGQHRKLKLDLAYIADIGLIGLPSAGKSSLLNALTKAHAKVGAYPFTTLEPNLGVFYGTVIADIPGLIEGAHTGKGLGIRFLKHIEKTKMLFHCIDITSDTLEKDYNAIRAELKSFNPKLLEKQEIILLTKSDEVTEEEAEKAEKSLQHLDKKILPVSIINDKQLKRLHKIITNV